MIKHGILLILLLTIISCTQTQEEKVSVKVHEHDYVWIQDNTIRYNNSKELAACLGIKETEFEKYIIIESTKENDTDRSFSEIKKTMHYEVSRKIVLLIKQKMEFTFKKTVFAEWEIDQISMPVMYRMFKKMEDGKIYYRYIAVYKKSDMDINKLLQFLPYEYKEPFLDEIQKRMKMESTW